jgi:hypothetical protein
VFFHGNASICTIILCSIPFLDLVMVLYELKRNQVIKDCCGTWFISYLAQLAHPLHNFHFEEGKVPKQHRVNCIQLKSCFTRNAYRTLHIASFFITWTSFSIYRTSKFVPIVYNTFEFVMVVSHTFEFV